MPLYDYYCEKCGATKEDVLVKIEDKVNCDMCDTEMRRKPVSFSFNFTPGAISKYKKKIGKNVPQEYKRTGGCNIYGVPRKN